MWVKYIVLMRVIQTKFIDYFTFLIITNRILSVKTT